MSNEHKIMNNEIVKKCKELVSHPGKFENKPAYVPYFYDILNDGEDNPIDIDQDDIKLFPELDGNSQIIITESNSGFVDCQLLTDDDKETIENSHLDYEVFEAGIIIGYQIENIEDYYQGQFDSDEEMAEELHESCYDIPDHLENYIDWGKVASDMMMDYSEENGHYFSG